MAVPEKDTWKTALKKQGKFGLSASSFGAALGHCGRVSDYVHYVRCYIGTDKEFRGNVATAHGIATEPLAKLAYEGLFQEAVEEGGFFVDESDALACSPDGIVKWTEVLPGVNTRITQRIEGPRSSPTSPTAVPRRVPFRVLEIKSPFRAFYSGAKEENQPFGIPQHYMCQMQGQMAISGASECDFFVFLRYPRMSAVAFRVHRSDEFWVWAKPKLLEVVRWIEAPDDVYQRMTTPSLPSCFLTRSFEFPHFDFSKIRVDPLLTPVDLVLGVPLVDPKVFPFFHRLSDDRKPAVPRGLDSPLVTLLAKARLQPGDVVLYSAAVLARRQRFVIDSDSDCDDVVPVHDPSVCQVISMTSSVKPVPVSVAATSPIPAAPSGSWRPLRQLLTVFTDAASPDEKVPHGAAAATKKHRSEVTTVVPTSSPAKRRLEVLSQNRASWDPIIVNLTEDVVVPLLRRSPETLTAGAQVTLLPPTITSRCTAVQWLLQPRRQSYRVLHVTSESNATVRCVLEPDPSVWGSTLSTALTPTSNVMCCSSRVVGLGTDLLHASWNSEAKAWTALLAKTPCFVYRRPSGVQRVVSIASRSTFSKAHQTDPTPSMMLLRADQLQPLLDDVLDKAAPSFDGGQGSSQRFQSCMSEEFTGGTNGTCSNEAAWLPHCRVWAVFGKESGSASRGPVDPRDMRWSSSTHPTPPVVLWINDLELDDLQLSCSA